MPEQIIVMPFAPTMGQSFIDYAMSVIQDRALPDAKDGLKPVHRRILFDMLELGLNPGTPYKKSARIVGDTLGKYHPHGDTSVYDAMVILAQDFSTRYPLVDGHGNFGSIDGDNAAAMRYTEAKMTHYGKAMLADINKNTVDYIDNYDGSEREPSVLPSLLPNLLANGVSGIAVGMATNIAPHNLGDLYDVIDYIISETLNGNEPDENTMITKIKGPDFPTGGVIVGTKGIIDAYKTGKGKIIVRSKYEIEDDKGKISIVVTEIPYKVNKAKLIETIDDLSKTKKSDNNKVIDAKLPWVKEVRDESDRDGMRIVIELKKGSNPQIAINNLLKHTSLQTSFGYNCIALNEGEPKQMGLKELLEIFLASAAQVIMRRTQFDLDKATVRLNIVNGVLKAIEPTMFESIVDVIRTADDTIEGLVSIGFNEAQAKYIIDMKLNVLAKTSGDKFLKEKEDLEVNTGIWTSILNDDAVLLSTMSNEFKVLREKLADDRRTEIIAGDSVIEDEDLIADESVVIILSSDGLIKSVPENEYRTQNRGGVGVKAANTSDDEILKCVLTASIKDDILFFTNQGRCHILKAYKIAKTSRTAKGKSINNYLSLADGESIVTIIAENKNNEKDILFVTKLGVIKRLPMSQLSSRGNVTRVISFRDNDELVMASTVSEEDNAIILTALGKGIRLAMNAQGNAQIRPMGRTAAGVKGITLTDNDYVVSMLVVEDDSQILIVTEGGLGKRTAPSQFTAQGRGGHGIIAHKVTEKTGIVVAATTVKEDDQLFVITEGGLITRMEVKNISSLGRATSGVKIMNLSEGDKIGSISRMDTGNN